MSSEIIENVHTELVLHPDNKSKVIFSKVQLVAMATASDKFTKNGRARVTKFSVFSLLLTSIINNQVRQC